MPASITLKLNRVNKYIEEKQEDLRRLEKKNTGKTGKNLEKQRD